MSNRMAAPERRRQLLDVAILAFGRTGFHETAMNDVAAQAGITKPVLYQHFESKRDLFSEVLRDIGTRLVEELAQAMTSADTDRDRVNAGYRAMAEFFDENPEAFQAMFNGVARHDPDFVNQVDLVEDLIASTVSRYITVEGLTEIEKEHLAYGLVGLGEGAMRRWISGGRPIPAAQLATLLTNAAWIGLDGGIGIALRETDPDAEPVTPG